MQRATTTPTQRSSKRTTHRQPSAPEQITPAQLWRQLSVSQQQALQRALTSVCRSLVNQTASHAGGEEVHDDRS